MELIYWYILFAVTTSITATYELFVPVINELNQNNIRNNITENKWLVYFTLFIITLVLAPIMLIVCVVPMLGNKYRETLVRELSKI